MALKRPTILELTNGTPTAPPSVAVAIDDATRDGGGLPLEVSPGDSWTFKVPGSLLARPLYRPYAQTWRALGSGMGGLDDYALAIRGCACLVTSRVRMFDDLTMEEVAYLYAADKRPKDAHVLQAICDRPQFRASAHDVMVQIFEAAALYNGVDLAKDVVRGRIATPHGAKRWWKVLSPHAYFVAANQTAAYNGQTIAVSRSVSNTAPVSAFALERAALSVGRLQRQEISVPMSAEAPLIEERLSITAENLAAVMPVVAPVYTRTNNVPIVTRAALHWFMWRMNNGALDQSTALAQLEIVAPLFPDTTSDIINGATGAIEVDFRLPTPKIDARLIDAVRDLRCRTRPDLCAGGADPLSDADVATIHDIVRDMLKSQVSYAVVEENKRALPVEMARRLMPLLDVPLDQAISFVNANVTKAAFDAFEGIRQHIVDAIIEYRGDSFLDTEALTEFVANMVGLVVAKQYGVEEGPRFRGLSLADVRMAVAILLIDKATSGGLASDFLAVAREVVGAPLDEAIASVLSRATPGAALKVKIVDAIIKYRSDYGLKAIDKATLQRSVVTAVNAAANEALATTAARGDNVDKVVAVLADMATNGGGPPDFLKVAREAVVDRIIPDVLYREMEQLASSTLQQYEDSVLAVITFPDNDKRYVDDGVTQSSRALFWYGRVMERRYVEQRTQDVVDRSSVVEPGESPFQPVALVENAAASLTGLPPYMWPAVEGRLAEWVAPFLAASRDVYIPPLFVGSAVQPRLTVSSAYRGYGPLAIAVPRGEPPLVRPLVSYRPDALDIVDVHLPFMGLIDEYDFDNALGWSIYSAKKYATATRVAICPVVPFLSEAVLESVAVDQIWPLGVDGPAASAVISARITSNLNWRGFVAMLDMVNGWIRDAVAAERARNTESARAYIGLWYPNWQPSILPDSLFPAAEESDGVFRMWDLRPLSTAQLLRLLEAVLDMDEVASSVAWVSRGPWRRDSAARLRSTILANTTIKANLDSVRRNMAARRVLDMWRCVVEWQELQHAAFRQDVNGGIPERPLGKRDQAAANASQPYVDRLVSWLGGDSETDRDIEDRIIPFRERRARSAVPSAALPPQTPDWESINFGINMARTPFTCASPVVRTHPAPTTRSLVGTELLPANTAVPPQPVKRLVAPLPDMWEPDALDTQLHRCYQQVWSSFRHFVTSDIPGYYPLWRDIPGLAGVFGGQLFNVPARQGAYPAPPRAITVAAGLLVMATLGLSCRPPTGALPGETPQQTARRVGQLEQEGPVDMLRKTWTYLQGSAADSHIDMAYPPAIIAPEQTSVWLAKQEGVAADGLLGWHAARVQARTTRNDAIAAYIGESLRAMGKQSVMEFMDVGMVLDAIGRKWPRIHELVQIATDATSGRIWTDTYTPGVGLDGNVEELWYAPKRALANGNDGAQWLDKWTARRLLPNAVALATGERVAPPYGGTYYAITAQASQVDAISANARRDEQRSIEDYRQLIPVVPPFIGENWFPAVFRWLRDGIVQITRYIPSERDHREYTAYGNLAQVIDWEQAYNAEPTRSALNNAMSQWIKDLSWRIRVGNFPVPPLRGWDDFVVDGELSSGGVCALWKRLSEMGGTVTVSPGDDVPSLAVYLITAALGHLPLPFADAMHDPDFRHAIRTRARALGIDPSSRGAYEILHARQPDYLLQLGIAPPADGYVSGEENLRRYRDAINDAETARAMVEAAAALGVHPEDLPEEQLAVMGIASPPPYTTALQLLMEVGYRPVQQQVSAGPVPLTVLEPEPEQLVPYAEAIRSPDYRDLMLDAAGDTPLESLSTEALRIIGVAAPPPGSSTLALLRAAGYVGGIDYQPPTAPVAPFIPPPIPLPQSAPRVLSFSQALLDSALGRRLREAAQREGAAAYSLPPAVYYGLGISAPTEQELISLSSAKLRSASATQPQPQQQTGRLRWRDDTDVLRGLEQPPSSRLSSTATTPTQSILRRRLDGPQ